MLVDVSHGHYVTGVDGSLILDTDPDGPRSGTSAKTERKKSSDVMLV